MANLPNNNFKASLSQKSFPTNSQDYFRVCGRYDRLGDHKIEYLIEDMLPRKGLGVLMGDTGAGKTQLAMRLAACLATGASVALCTNQNEGMSISNGIPLKPYSTLYFVGEGKDGIRSRISSAEQAASLDMTNLPAVFENKLPIITVLAGKMRLRGAEQIDALLKETHSLNNFFTRYAYPLGLIVFDTLAASFDIHDENSNSEMQKIVAALVEYGECFNCFVLVIAHPPKSKDHVRGYTRGASALINSADVVLELKKINNSSHRLLKVSKMRDGPSEDAEFALKVETFDGVPALVPASILLKGQNRRIKESIVLTENQEKTLAAIKHVVRDGLFWEDSVLLRLFEVYTVGGGEGKKSASVKKQLKRDLRRLHQCGLIQHNIDKSYSYPAKIEQSMAVAEITANDSSAIQNC